MQNKETSFWRTSCHQLKLAFFPCSKTRALSDMCSSICMFHPFSNIPIYEGTYVTNRYTVDTSNVDQKFLLNDNRADTTTLTVDVFAPNPAPFEPSTKLVFILKYAFLANLFHIDLFLCQ